MLKEDTLAALRERAKEYGVKKLMLFGSCLYKPEEEAGDIDLAAEMLSGFNIFKFHGDILLEVGLKAQKDIDMVDLTHNIPIVPYILEEGIIIYENSEQN
jgi:predicted nucleotidyltransferase